MKKGGAQPMCRTKFGTSQMQNCLVCHRNMSIQPSCTSRACSQPCFCLRWAHSGWLRGPRHKQTAPRAVLGATLDCAQLTSEWLHSKSQPHRSDWCSAKCTSHACIHPPLQAPAVRPCHWWVPRQTKGGWGGVGRGGGCSQNHYFAAPNPHAFTSALQCMGCWHHFTFLCACQNSGSAVRYEPRKLAVPCFGSGLVVGGGMWPPSRWR
jgi:hypothetical protein